VESIEQPPRYAPLREFNDLRIVVDFHVIKQRATIQQWEIKLVLEDQQD